jgi:hypothetical protein
MPCSRLDRVKTANTARQEVTGNHITLKIMMVGKKSSKQFFRHSGEECNFSGYYKHPGPTFAEERLVPGQPSTPIPGISALPASS